MLTRSVARSFSKGVFLYAALLTLAFVSLACSGCVSLLGAPRMNAADVRFAIGKYRSPQFSQGTLQTLRAYGLPANLSDAQLDALQRKTDADPTPELVYAYVETAYLYARKLESKQPSRAKQLYVSSALYAYHYLFNPALNAQNDSVFNAQFRDVCILYNGSCERLLHLELQNVSSDKFPFRHASVDVIRCQSEEYSVYTQIETCSWRKEEIDSFQVVSDCPVDQVSFDCRRSGLGVPLVAKRRPVTGYNRPEEEYYPGGLCVPATAIVRPNPTLPLGSLPPIDPYARFQTQEESNAQVILEIYDPLVSQTANVEGRELELESDTTTPLAYFLNERSQLANVAKKGLLHPQEMLEVVSTSDSTIERTLQGLYLLEPYDPNKIPVVMTHGLASSPTTWLEMYNALRNASEIQSSYQFWFFFYPTGQPFWASAASLRSELQRLRNTVDPAHSAPTLDQTVLVGHSMGGLISKMQVQTSEDKIWQRISSTPLEQLDFDEETRQNLRSWFFFDANPSIKRVITIATPFEGSDFANNFTQWIAEQAISIPQAVARAISTMNSEDYRKIDNPTLLQTTTSIDSLSPKCSIFQALDECQTPDDVELDNIVGVIPSIANRRFNPKKTDGVVDYWSSHREDADTETEVADVHTHIHMHPTTILEVKELLSQHLRHANGIPFRRIEQQGRNNQFEENAAAPNQTRSPQTLDNPYVDSYWDDVRSNTQGPVYPGSSAPQQYNQPQTYGPQPYAPQTYAPADQTQPQNVYGPTNDQIIDVTAPSPMR